MRDRVENSLTHGPLAERGHIQHDEADLIVLLVVAKIDEVPKGVVAKQKPLLKLDALTGRTRGIAGAILEDDLSAGSKASERSPSPKQDERGVRDAFAGYELGVPQEMSV
jgi:hypothetical protein